MHPDSSLRMPALTPALRQNFTWRYYYSGEFPFSRSAVRHVRWRRFRAAARRLSAVSPPGALLDVGCGPGESTLFLCRRLGAARAYGLDISRDCVWFANRLAEANALPGRFFVGSAARLPMATGTMDLVVSFETIEHLPNWREFFGESRRVLRRGGHLLVTTPNALSVHSMLKGLYRRFRGFDRLNRAWQKDGDFYEVFLSDPTLVSGLVTAGFEPVACEHVAFVLTVQPDWTVPPIRSLEPLLERLPGVRRLAVTSVLLARVRTASGVGRRV